MTDTLTERLERCYTAVVHDVMRALGLRDFTLPPELRPLIPEKVLAGPAFTIDGMVDPAADPHATLLAWTGLLSQARPGHVWVSQPNDRVVAHMGELSAETLANKGVRGCIADGGIRDVAFLLKVGYWLPRAVDMPITIGEVRIAPGDYMLGDRDGLIRIPAGIAEQVIGLAETAIETENRVRSAILAGVDPQEAYLKHGKF